MDEELRAGSRDRGTGSGSGVRRDSDAISIPIGIGSYDVSCGFERLLGGADEVVGVHQDTRIRLIKNARALMLGWVRRAMFDSDEEGERAKNGVRWLSDEAIAAHEHAASAYENARHQLDRANKLQREVDALSPVQPEEPEVLPVPDAPSRPTLRPTEE